jgi:hypothetical protein
MKTLSNLNLPNRIEHLDPSEIQNVAFLADSLLQRLREVVISQKEHYNESFQRERSKIRSRLK